MTDNKQTIKILLEKEIMRPIFIRYKIAAKLFTVILMILSSIVIISAQPSNIKNRPANKYYLQERIFISQNIIKSYKAEAIKITGRRSF